MFAATMRTTAAMVEPMISFVRRDSGGMPNAALSHIATHPKITAVEMKKKRITGPLYLGELHSTELQRGAIARGVSTVLLKNRVSATSAFPQGQWERGGERGRHLGWSSKP